MPSLGIAPCSGGCVDREKMSTQGMAPVSNAVSGGRIFASTGNWDVGNPAFTISHGSSGTPLLALDTDTAFLACCCPVHLSDPGKPLDPRTLLRVPPEGAGPLVPRPSSMGDRCGLRVC